VSSLAPILRFVMAARGWPCPPAVIALAERLPPVPAAGLELPLTGAGRTDLQQRIRGPEEQRRLARWLARQQNLSAPWQRLRDALGTLESQLEEVWLELDDGADDPPLSVFARLPPSPQTAARSTVDSVLDAFHMTLSARQHSALDLCLGACAGPVSLSHIGLMLGRPGAPLRLVIDGVPPEDIAAFLQGIGWPGARDRAVEWSERLFVYADRIRLVLTVGDGLAPDLGFECFVGHPAVTDPRWRCLLDSFVDLGLCAPDQSAQLLAWPSTLTPILMPEWPDALLIDALLRDPQDVRWLQCRLSHVKVTLPDRWAPFAKGYVGFLEVQDEPPPAPGPQRRPTPHGLSGAVDDAVAFLLGARVQGGWWLDYDGFAEGAAEEWVTAYVANALHACLRAGAAQAARRAWQLLARRARQGWGWNGLQPPDADSTIWGLRLAAGLRQMESPAARQAAAFLRSHVTADGGICTYRHGVHRGRADGIEINPGWYEAHGCVTAAAAHLPGFGTATLDYLRHSQQADGTWRGYWWRSDTYTTALAAEALSEDVADEPRVALAVAAARAALDASDEVPLTPFETALSLRTLLMSGGTSCAAVEKARGMLLATQMVDGSWPASAALSIPNHKGEIVPALDNRRCLTTATVLTALAALETKAREP
jgi:hypothetical protein